MEKSSSQKALKVIAIIMIVFAAFSILGGLFAAFGGGALGSAAITAGDDKATVVGGVALLGGIMMLIGGIINLVIGLLGLRGANNPQKIGAFFVLSIIGFVFAALSLVSILMSGAFDITTLVSDVIGLALPLICVLLAYNIKKETRL
ncbi:MAG: hypothetical protein RR323_06330 [Raoultibacter sp.]